jgi:hypothetical protein
VDRNNSGRFPEVVYVQAPAGLNRALDQVAAKQHTTRSELVRRTLMREVATAGVALDEPSRVASHG